MCKGLIGRKLGMMGIFSSKGDYLPVTVVEVGPCTVTQIKSKSTDGYDALQLGFGERKHVNRPLEKHFEKSGGKKFFVLKEIQIEDSNNLSDYKVGQVITADLFKIGQKVDVVGISKGRGFAGVIKRHGFSGGDDTHGCMSHRVPGSVGSSAWPSRVLKGKKLPGHYGHSRKKIKNLEIIDVRSEKNLILIKGALPGPKMGIIEISQLSMPKNAKLKKS